MAKILVTGGAVHAHLDAIKIITNGFKGGRMAELAVRLQQLGHEVTYLTNREGCGPLAQALKDLGEEKMREVHVHDGFDSYMNEVLDRAPKYDSVVLGAAVANLIPLEPWKGKFPSHNYSPGDRIDIPFTIAPRVVDQVRKRARNTRLFAFKLLAGVPHEELFRAAYDICIEAGATLVFANDRRDLDTVYPVAKEAGDWQIDRSELPEIISRLSGTHHFRTETVPVNRKAPDEAKELLDRFSSRFVRGPKGHFFGSVMYVDGCGWWTTPRGKTSQGPQLELLCGLNTVQPLAIASAKLSLNAPTMTVALEKTEKRLAVHLHEMVPGAPTVEYWPPGTIEELAAVRDAVAKSPVCNIQGHGCIVCADTISEAEELLRGNNR